MSLATVYPSTNPSLSLDFTNSRKLDERIQFTRTGTATFFDKNGVLQTVGADVPRINYDPVTGGVLGLLIEEGRTNSIRNSQAGGATVGVIGSGGALPTNWGISSNFTGTGLTREVIGIGTANGFAYMDVKISGTNTSGSGINPGFALESGTQIAALSGQTWTSSVYVALASGSLSGITSIGVSVVERSSGGIFLTDSRTSILSMTSSLTRFEVTRTLTNATTAFVNPAIIGNIDNGSTVDFTLRIAAPQLEQGSFATSYIPTTSAAVSRGADVAVVTPISSFVTQTGDESLFAEFSAYTYGATGSFPRIVQLDQGSTNTERYSHTIVQSASNVFITYSVNNVGQFSANSSPTYSLNSTAKTASGIAFNNARHAFNGVLIGADDTSITLRTSQNTHLQIGNDKGTGIFLNGHIRKVAYWPKRLSNTELRNLTL